MPDRSRWSVLLLFFLTSCMAAPGVPTSASPPAFVTSTLPATATPGITEIARTATVTSTPGAHPGSTTTQVNVRSEPASASVVLGILPPSAIVQVIGKDRNGNWYQILFEAGEAGTGWISAAYVVIPDKAAVPVAQTLNELTAAAREQINVRAGPGTDFEALGTLNQGDVVALTGRDRSGAWMQINFAAGADGKGWVAASFLDSASNPALPVVAEGGEVLGTPTPTPTSVALVPSATIRVAREDGDSEAQPAAQVRFSPRDVGSISFVGDLSAPQGDASDWIQITPYYPGVGITLGCIGSAQVRVGLLQSGTPSARDQVPTCGETRQIALDAGATYLLRLQVASDSGAAVYVQYKMGISGALPP